MRDGGAAPQARHMILVDQLTKRYGRYTAVDSISFSVRPGTVTGFLGPNGAGKSTTMRVMVGLTVPTSGTATINGEQFADLPNPGLEVGVLLDASAQHAGRTGREILTIAADTMGLPRRRVDEMLELVSLTSSEAKRRVRNYSLGMRQRLGIGTALLGDPRVLILDEPANGLDPAGIRWMRDLLTGFASQGGTVLLSSHLLHEIEVIADDLVVIGNGKIVASGSKEELLAAAGTLVRSTSPRDLAHALERAGIPSTLAGDGSVRTDADPARVGAVALTAGIALTEIRSAEGTGLEDMFLSLTADTQREGVAA
jgi:ABC-2 type transport system ATP-binding protein